MIDKVRGKKFVIIAESLVLKVVFYKIESKLPFGNTMSIVNLAPLFCKSYIGTLNLADTPTTKNISTAKELKLMKQGSVIINASRSSVINSHALAQTIKTKHLKGVAINFFQKEISSDGELFESEFIKLNNVFLISHLSSSRLEAKQNVAVKIVDALIKYSDNGSSILAVNFPKLSLLFQDNVNRILDVYEKMPGMIKRVLFDHNINIAGQCFQTLVNMNYVVIASHSSEEILQALVQKIKAIKDTIHLHFLF